MGDEISSKNLGQVRAANSVPPTAADVRAQLRGLASDLVSSKGGVKSGYLKLIEAKGVLRAGTRWTSRATDSTAHAVAHVKDLVRRGYEGTAVDIEKVNTSIDEYLSKKGGQRIGTHSFVRLVKALESIANQNEDGLLEDGNQGKRLQQRFEIARVKRDERGLGTGDFRRVSEASLAREANLRIDSEPGQGANGKLGSGAEGGIEGRDSERTEVKQPVLENERARELLAADAQRSDQEQVLREDDVPPLVAGPSDPLSKANELSVDYAAKLTAKKFNVLVGEFTGLGRAIDDSLRASGLKAPRGISRIQLNGEKVYCYFDSGGKARAILPKGSSIQGDQKFRIATLEIEASEDYQDKFYNVGGDLKKLEGGEFVSFDQGTLITLLRKTLEITLRKDTTKLESIRDAYNEHGRALFQLVIDGQPWLVDLNSIPGKSKPDFPPNRGRVPAFVNDVSCRFVPLREKLSDTGLVSVAELAREAPWARLENKATVKLNPDYSGVLTTGDGAYVKKFYQVNVMEAEFFEHVLSHEEKHPGISNRLLAGVPTADMKKKITPVGGAGGTFLNAKLDDGARAKLTSPAEIAAYYQKVELAALQAIDDMAVAIVGGFSPSSKVDSFLFNPDPSQEKLEICMIDFDEGRPSQSSAEEKAKIFRDASDSVGKHVKGFFVKSELLDPESLEGLIPKLQQHAAERLVQTRWS